MSFDPDEEISSAKLLKGEYELQRYTEARDFHGNPKWSTNPLNREGELYTPLLDKRYINSGNVPPVWPEDKEFAVLLGHDVDNITRSSWREELREVRQNIQILVEGNWEKTTKSALRLTWDTVQSTVSIPELVLDPDSLGGFDQILKLERKFNARSTFYFPPDTPLNSHKSDPNYRYTDPVTYNDQKMTVADLLAEIDSEGWEIGVHPTWNSFDNVEEMLHQKQSVETQIPGEVGSVRQHHLHWDPRITPEVHENVGLIHDSSAQVGGNIGFRFGTSYPWKLYDQEQEQTEVLEIPIAVSGATLLKPWNMNLTVTESKKYIARLAENVKEVGGVFGLHFHPLRIINDKRYFKLYEYALKYLSENGAWFAPAAEIAQWWKQNNSSIRVH